LEALISEHGKPEIMNTDQRRLWLGCNFD